MKKNFLLWLALSAAIMLLLPWLAVTFLKGDSGMAICFILFFAVNPVYSVLTGIFAGKAIRTRWSLPVVTAILFLLGTWIFFDMGETAFLLYAGVYLFAGLLCMFLSGYHQKSCRRPKVTVQTKSEL